MLTVAEVIAEAGLPDGSVSILPMTRELGDRLVSDARFKLLTFNRQPRRGLEDEERAGKKKVVLELGGNAGVIVDATADLDWAVRRVVSGAFSYAGQICISVQRLFVHDAVREDFVGRFAEAARGLKVGDPLDPTTDVGPMVERRRGRANAGMGGRGSIDGGRALLGGTADGAFFPPTILTDVPPSARVCAAEAFAPLVVVFRVRRLRRRAPRRQRQPLRAPGRCLHQRSRPRLVRLRGAGGRWRRRQRRPDLPHRQHALRRLQGLGHRPRGCSATPSKT